MAEIHVLDLGIDCLLLVLAHISDFRSFYNFSITCKQFWEITGRPRWWHVNVVKRKARFYATRFVVEELPSSESSLHPNAVLTVREVLRWANICDTMKPTLANALKVWESRGPVAAQLFLWIREFETIKDVLGAKVKGRSFYIMKHVAIIYPGGNEVEVGCLNYWSEDDTLTVHSNLVPIEDHSNYDDDEEVEAEDGPLWERNHVTEFSSYLRRWDTEKTPLALRKTLNYIQKVVGPTSLPLTAKFLLQCFFLPDELREICPDVDLTCKEEDKIFFQDASWNVKPTEGFADFYYEAYDSERGKIKRLMKVVEESANVTELCKVGKFLHLSEQNDTCSFLANIVDMLKDVSEETLVELILRTDFSYDMFESEKSGKTVVNGVFRLLDGAEAKLKLYFKIGKQMPIGLVLLIVTIPGNEEVIIVDGNVPYPVSQEAFSWLPKFRFPDIDHDMTAISRLQPFTDMVKKCLVGGGSIDDVRLSNFALWRLICMDALRESTDDMLSEFVYCLRCSCSLLYDRSYCLYKRH